MKRTKHLLCLIVASLLVSAFPVYGQESGDTVLDALRELTKEVRLLHKTMETATIASTRSQLVVERLRMQHDVVEAIRRRVTATGESVTSAGEQIVRIEAYRNASREQLDSEYDPGVRENLLRGIKEVENELAVLEARKAQLEAQQSELRVRLADEEARVDEIRDQLQSLEAELERLMKRDE